MCSTEELQRALQLEMDTDSGLTLAVQDNQGQFSGVAVPTRMVGGVVSDVHDGKAYVAFKRNGKVYKTTEIKDRDALMEWADKPSELRRERFSDRKEHEGLIGPGRVNLHVPMFVATA